MVPFPMLPTTSSAERRLYEGFLAQLGSEYVVYHSVDWVLGPRRPGESVVQGEADFIIAHPVDGILVVEAKGGELSYDRATSRWWQAGRSGKHHLDEDPFHQARDEMLSLIEILTHQPGWDRWRPSYGYGVALPDGRIERDAHPAARAEWVIDRDDMDRLEARVKEVMRAWSHPGRRFRAEGMAALERALGFRMEVRTPLQLQFDQEDREIFELTNDQAYVLSYVTKLHRAAIVGPAGSGKTMLALAITSRLAGGGTKTLLTCFNWRLADHLRANVEAPQAQVVHFHELCRQLSREAGLTVPDEPTEEAAARDHFERVLPRLLAEAAKVLGPRYDAIVVDGAQDFLPTWWASLLSLHRKPDDGFLFLFADDARSLYGESTPQGLTDLTLTLPENLRNTKPIHEFVSVFHGGRQKAAARGPSGRPVEVFGYKDEEGLARLLALVLENLEKEGISLEDVAVLIPGRRAESVLRQRGRANGYELSDEPAPGKVLTVNVQGFKGLERPVVILAEVGDLRDEELAKHLYVGGSRARDHLIVLAAEGAAKKLRQLAGVQAN
jgi:UvrD-like helicase family protein/AAA domain-containing protein